MKRAEDERKLHEEAEGLSSANAKFRKQKQDVAAENKEFEREAINLNPDREAEEAKITNKLQN